MLYTEHYMKKTTLALIIIGIVVLAIGTWAYFNWRAYAPSEYVTETETATGTETTTVNTETGTSTPGSPSFTQAQVAEHNNATSCYTIIHGSVYDLTMWVAMHPGGKQAILSLCGTDGTAKFTAKHGSQPQQNAVLARFKIGVVAR